MEVNVAINIKVDALFRGGGECISWGRKIAKKEIFPPPGDFVMGETLFRDTGRVWGARPDQQNIDKYWDISNSTI